MKDLLILIAYLLTTIEQCLGPGDTRAIVADCLLTKQQLLIINRTQQRSPKLAALDRFLMGFCSLFLLRRNIRRGTVIIQPSTLLKFHQLLKHRNYRLLYFSSGNRKPGPTGPSKRQRNSSLHCRHESTESHLWLSTNSTTDQPCL